MNERWCIDEIKWPVLVQTVSQSAAESKLPAGVQLMLIGVKLSTTLVAITINNGKSIIYCIYIIRSQ